MTLSGGQFHTNYGNCSMPSMPGPRSTTGTRTSHAMPSTHGMPGKQSTSGMGE